MKHPFQIAIGPNPPENCFDLHIQFGRFKGQADAQKFADELVALLKENHNAFALRAQ